MNCVVLCYVVVNATLVVYGVWWYLSVRDARRYNVVPHTQRWGGRARRWGVSDSATLCECTTVLEHPPAHWQSIKDSRVTYRCV